MPKLLIESAKVANLKCQSSIVQNLQSGKFAKCQRYDKIVCHCLYHASTRIDVVTHMPLWTYISCHPFRDVHTNRAATPLTYTLRLQAGLLPWQASQTSNTPTYLLPLGYLQSWAWLSLTIWLERRHDGPTEGIELWTLDLKSRALTPRPTMTNLDYCTNLVEVIQLWLWSCIWNILVIVNAIYQGKK